MEKNAADGEGQGSSTASGECRNRAVGRYARSIESGWLGKVVGIEGDMLRMQGVNELVRTIRGGDIEDCLDDDDTQWFVPEDVRFVNLI